MNYDIEYKIFQYICKEADEYVPFQKLLHNNGLTFKEALGKTSDYRRYYFDMLEKYGINARNTVSVCTDLTELLKKNPEDNGLQFIYFATVTDIGLLLDCNQSERSNEQNIKNWLEQKKRTDKLIKFQKENMNMKKRLNEFICNLRVSDSHSEDNAEEQSEVYRMSLKHEFLKCGRKNEIYFENIGELIRQINSCKELQSVKPYVIFAVLTRKNKLIMERENYSPNIRNIFRYQEYRIECDNGKNFDSYQSYIELYEHMRRFYLDSPEVDIAFSDYCFANTSPLSIWYYQNCEPDEDIPMDIWSEVNSLKSMIFPIIYNYHDYENFSSEEFYNKYPNIENLFNEYFDRNYERILNEFLECLYHERNISEYAEEFYISSKAYEVCGKRKQLQKASELFLYMNTELFLEKTMIDLSFCLV
ncbi:MAG: hypothetical protein K2I06_10085 [Ruminococcus sp.]|nr:hypothetical protein [Ruminococcus sp.]